MSCHHNMDLFKILKKILKNRNFQQSSECFSSEAKISEQLITRRTEKTIKAQDAFNSKAGFSRLAILKIGL